jgi:thiamine-phosphate diphosphorylase
VTTDALCRAADFGVRAAAIAAGGPAVAIVVRAPESTAAQQLAFTERVAALARPPEAAVVAHGRPDLARAVGTAGVQLRGFDLTPADARRVFPGGWIGRSVHSAEEAEAAVGEGADYLLAGSVFDSASHPGQPARGMAWVTELTRFGRPVVAIGGVTPERVAALRDAGAWGTAAIRAVWDARDPAAATAAMLRPWTEEG